jgi:hypothetical protein
MEDLDPEDRCGRWLDQRVQPSQRWAARGVRVWHWRRPRPAPPPAAAPPRAKARAPAGPPVRVKATPHRAAPAAGH